MRPALTAKAKRLGELAQSLSGHSTRESGHCAFIKQYSEDFAGMGVEVSPEGIRTAELTLPTADDDIGWVKPYRRAGLSGVDNGKLAG